MCCGNASRNHKLKLVVIGKSKKPLSFKGIEANCIRVHYCNQKGTWLDREMFKNWFYKHFFPEVWAFLKERITTESSVSARLCFFSSKRECTDFWRWPHHCKVFAPQYHSYFQPMDQGVIASME
jgi:hypothetical protein